VALHLKWAIEYKSPLISYWMGPNNKILVTDPALLNEVLNNVKLFTKNVPDYTILGDALGYSLLTTSDEAYHKYQRSLCDNAFKYSYIKQFVPIFQSQSEKLVEHFNSNIGNNFDITKLMSALTLDIIGLSSFECDFQSLESESEDTLSNKYLQLMHTMEPSLLYLIPYASKLPLARFKKRAKLILEIKKYVNFIIEQKRNKGLESSNDLLSILMSHNNDPQNKKLSDQELVGICLTFLIAGHETTSQLLCWVLYALAKNPAITDKCVTEIENSEDRENVNSLPYLTNVIRETLRLYAPVAIVKRKAEADVKLGDYVIPKVISPLVIHRLPSLWENPEEFNPSRWESEKDISQKFIPFLTGPRNCIGWRFALLEAKIILSVLLPKFNFTMAKDAPEVTQKMRITLRPFPALMMNVTPR